MTCNQRFSYDYGMTKTNDAITITDALGGPTATASFFGIEQPSVSEWRSRGVIPRARLRHLQDVRPDVLPEHLRRPEGSDAA